MIDCLILEVLNRDNPQLTQELISAYWRIAALLAAMMRRHPQLFTVARCEAVDVMKLGYRP